MRLHFVASVFSLLFMGLISCKAQQKTSGPQPTKDPTVYKGVTDPACAMEMQFGSYGSGIDGKAVEKLKQAIAKYNVTYTSKSIGREGEVRYCMPLTELNSKKKKAFIAELKKIAREGQLVSVSLR